MPIHIVEELLEGALHSLVLVMLKGLYSVASCTLDDLALIRLSEHKVHGGYQSTKSTEAIRAQSPRRISEHKVHGSYMHDQISWM